MNVVDYGEATRAWMRMVMHGCKNEWVVSMIEYGDKWDTTYGF